MKRRMRAACALALSAMLASGAAAESVDLLEVDHRLYELGYRDSACDGVLDEVMVNALKNFQLANGLEITGEADEATVARLFDGAAVSEAEYLDGFAAQYDGMDALSEGSAGENVTRLQRALKTLGYFDGASDGAFGDATEAAVCRFRLANGLPAETGVADGSVFLRLYGGAAASWDEFLTGVCASVGDSGAQVRTLQNWLRRRGYFHGECTGRYGEDTQQAVRQLQVERGLETSGDVDLDTARALFEGAAELLLGGGSVRRGDTGDKAEAVCRDLAALGYPAHARFNMQSELALMEFQLVNDLTVTGVADPNTAALLHSERAARRDSHALGALSMPEDDALPGRIARRAVGLLGQQSELDADFGLVEYVYLKCGVPLLERAQLSASELEPGEEVAPGAILGVEVGGRERMGIATADQALIYRAESGYIVMSYLEALKPERIQVYAPAEAGA